ncbi:MAG: tetratricopeptide repeat protein [Thermomicrobiales bacterium]
MNGVGNELTADEQRARVLALRGLSQARAGNLAAAEESFGRAISLDPEIDLRRLPAFWSFPRDVHETALRALQVAGRRNQAASLIADMRTRFRPRLLPVRVKR